ncbi:TPA: helix-turn-helix transcriptional regulator [Clostridioides difficile]|nr:helix-turn-helix transcriptional regulator [Clostridioides difficile]HBG5378105.1 helix-turn-helix transcriptional regulator [Clostridioides difficile]HBG5512492.1 helix-turn-helix transcriptional regulator [Clostridioides difficile]HBY2769171.1 helix-turn-helix transcriptional regulator [Clostridioides difficile]HBY2877717.1 helix-turn-helix transcriptional regulator [Clostridioides difficile]
MNFGQRLKEIRVQKNLTGEELGKILNVTKVAISNWESGRRFPSQNISLDFFTMQNKCKTRFYSMN